MKNKDDEIKRKLDELETTILKEQTSKANLSAPGQKDPILVTTKSTEVITKSDGYYFGGLLSIGLGLVILFQTVRVSSGLFSMLGIGGGGGFGLLLIPLLIGMGWLMYDSKAKMAWLLTAASCLIIVLAVLGSLIMYIPSLPLLTMLMILFPLALGGALLLKGAGGPKAVVEEIKKLKS